MARARILGALLACALPFAGCGSSSSTRARLEPVTITNTAAVSSLSRSCPMAALEALEGVAHRVYGESASGRIVAEAIYRLKSSRALAQAVEEGNRGAAHRILEGLLLNQIVSVRVTRAGSTVAKIERGAGIAPRSETLSNAQGQPVGRFTLSVQGANGYAQTLAGLLHAQVIVRSSTQPVTATLRPPPKLV